MMLFGHCRKKLSLLYWKEKIHWHCYQQAVANPFASVPAMANEGFVFSNKPL